MFKGKLAVLVAVALLVIAQYIQKLLTAEIGPQGLGHVYFRISDLPQGKLLIRISPLVRINRSGSGI